ncbi:MAG: hypothetical protein OWS74_03845 [Firmicutes bacterium]|nr:hypothetical protein [Bacillota bacterium]
MPWWKNWSKVGAVSMGVTAAVYLAVSWGQKAPVATRVPVLVHYVPAGGMVKEKDYHWVAVGQLTAVKVGQGYARSALWPGEILTSAALSAQPPAKGVIVSVVPHSSAQDAVAQAGHWVDILVIQSGGKPWQSGPVMVVAGPDHGSNLLGTAGSGFSIRCSLAQAVAFEQAKAQGIVDVVGLSS